MFREHFLSVWRFTLSFMQQTFLFIPRQRHTFSDHSVFFKNAEEMVTKKGMNYTERNAFEEENCFPQNYFTLRKRDAVSLELHSRVNRHSRCSRPRKDGSDKNARGKYQLKLL
jgi:hypothetical protein